MSSVALKLVPAPLPESTVPAWRVRLVGLSYTKKDERAERDVLGWVLCGGDWPRFGGPSSGPNGGAVYPGVAERAAGQPVSSPSLGSAAGAINWLRADHFFSPFNRQVFVACSAARAKDGSVHPSRVLECLRFYGHTAASVATELAQLMRESLEFAEPPSFQSFLERAELRLRVMRLEREADELRKGLR